MVCFVCRFMIIPMQIPPVAVEAHSLLNKVDSRKENKIIIAPAVEVVVATNLLYITFIYSLIHYQYLTHSSNFIHYASIHICNKQNNFLKHIHDFKN